MMKKQIQLMVIIFSCVFLSACWDKKEKIANQDQLIVMNVLDKKLYNDCHIKNSISVPLNEIEWAQISESVRMRPVTWTTAGTVIARWRNALPRSRRPPRSTGRTGRCATGTVDFQRGRGRRSTAPSSQGSARSPWPSWSSPTCRSAPRTASSSGMQQRR